MLPRYKKLHLNKDFDQVFKTGRSIYGRFLGLKIVKNNLPYSRFGLMLGLKIDKSAVTRHFYKRGIYNIIAKKEAKLPFPIDCVIIALPAIKDAKFTELEQEIDFILSKVSNKF